MSILEDAEIVKEFITETNDHLEDIESKILLLEDTPDDLDLINGIFRPIHSMKGSAGFLGLTEIGSLSHELETLLDDARKGKIDISSDIINLLLDSIDTFKRLIANLTMEVEGTRGGSDSEGQAAALSEEVQSLMQRVTELMKSAAAGAAQTAPAGQGKADTEPAISLDTEQAFEWGSEEGEGEDAASSKEEKDPRPLGEILVSEGVVTEPQVESALEVQNRKVGEILVDRGATTQDKINDALKKQKIFDKGTSTTVKVHITKLDNLVNLVGELVISQALLNEEFSTISGNGNSKNIAHHGKITKEIQDQVMSLRMIPIKPTFQKMSRLVRDLSAKAGKKINLEISGENTELDKTVIEQIGDPLVHIIRNSVDHGIESAEERITKGKPGTGTIKLNAFYKGGNIIIEIADDGKGLSKEKILNKALERGVIDEQSTLSDSQIYNLVFAAGFSTADKVTDISGRGVGMDVVKRNIEKLRGKVDISSQEGLGTMISIKLPLTLAIIDGMIVEVGGDKFVVPILSIEESFRPKTEDVSTVQSEGEVVNVRGNILPIVRLHRLFNIEPKKSDPCEALLVIVEGEGIRFCLLVDDLIGQQQVVIKSLGDKLRSVKGVTGGAILGDGKVALILDISGISTIALH